MDKPTTSVGVGVFLLHRGQVLLGKRRSIRGAGSWGLVGGHLDYGESLADCARREVLEEVGVILGNVHQLNSVTTLFDDGKHAVTTFYACRDFTGEVANLEPHLCEAWQWFDPQALPSPLFLPLQNYLQTFGYPDDH